MRVCVASPRLALLNPATLKKEMKATKQMLAGEDSYVRQGGGVRAQAAWQQCVLTPVMCVQAEDGSQWSPCCSSSTDGAPIDIDTSIALAAALCARGVTKNGVVVLWQCTSTPNQPHRAHGTRTTWKVRHHTARTR